MWHNPTQHFSDITRINLNGSHVSYNGNFYFLCVSDMNYNENCLCVWEEREGGQWLYVYVAVESVSKAINLCIVYIRVCILDIKIKKANRK